MLNHGLYTDCLWAVPVTFRDEHNNPVDLSGAEYIAELFQNGNVVFTFRSTGAAADEGEIDTTDAATGILSFTATVVQHADVAAGAYRLHLVRDAADDIWIADGSVLIGAPGDPESYLKIDAVESGDGSVALPYTITIGSTGRQKLTANTTFYIRTDGSDSNDGLANTSGGAFLTLQKAVNVVCALQLNGYIVTIQIADGTYVGARFVPGTILDGNVVIKGNASNVAAVKLTSQTTNGLKTCLDCSSLYGNLAVIDLTLQIDTCAAVVASGDLALALGWNPAAVTYHKFRIGGAVASNVTVCQFANAQTQVYGDLSIDVSGSVYVMFSSLNTGIVLFYPTTLAMVQSLTIGLAFARASYKSSFYTDVDSYTGTVTGRRARVDEGAYMDGMDGMPGTLEATSYIDTSTYDSEYLSLTADVVASGDKIPIEDISVPRKKLITASELQKFIYREKITANRTYYLRADGNNNNDGLSNTAGGAWRTLSKAFTHLRDNVYVPSASTVITLQLADGTGYGDVSAILVQPNMQIEVKGNTTTPANVEIGELSLRGTAGLGTYVYVTGVTFNLTGKYSAVSAQGSIIVFCGADAAFNYGPVRYRGTPNSSFYLFDVQSDAGVECYSPTMDIDLTGSFSFRGLVRAWSRAYVYWSNSTISIGATLLGKTPSVAWIVTAGGGSFYSDITLSGAASGLKYDARGGGKITVSNVTIGSTEGKDDFLSSVVDRASILSTALALTDQVLVRDLSADNVKTAELGELQKFIARDKLTADRTYYVRTDGNNSNTGLANTSGGAWATLQYAYDYITNALDLNGKVATIQIADGTYAGTLAVPYQGAPTPNGWIYIRGNVSTPANVVLGGTIELLNIAGRSTIAINGITCPNIRVEYAKQVWLGCSPAYSDFGGIKLTDTDKLVSAAYAGCRVEVFGTVRIENNCNVAFGYYNLATGYVYAALTVPAGRTVGRVIAAWYMAYVDYAEITGVTGGTITGKSFSAIQNSKIGAVWNGTVPTSDAGEAIDLGVVFDTNNGGVLKSDVVSATTYTVATLPSASTRGAGARAFVTDANATTFASVVAGGGSNGVPVYSDGTNWRIG